jgi:hypothetical protein
MKPVNTLCGKMQSSDVKLSVRGLRAVSEVTGLFFYWFLFPHFQFQTKR